MKIIMKSILVVLFLMVPSQVLAEDGFYLKGGGGVFSLGESNFEFNDIEGREYKLGNLTAHEGFSLSTSIGKSFGNFDYEIEYAFKKANYNDFEGKSFEIPEDVREARNLDPNKNSIVPFHRAVDSFEIAASIDIQTLMLNGIYNINNKTMFTPYAGVGFGVAFVDIDGDDGAWDMGETLFAYQVLAGLSVDVWKKLSILGQYRYLGMGDVTNKVNISELLAYPLQGEESLKVNSHSYEIAFKYSF